MLQLPMVLALLASLIFGSATQKGINPVQHSERVQPSQSKVINPVQHSE